MNEGISQSCPNRATLVLTWNTQWKIMTLSAFSLAVYIMMPSLFPSLAVLCATIYIMKRRFGDSPLFLRLRMFFPSLIGPEIEAQQVDHVMEDQDERFPDANAEEVVIATEDKKETIFPILQILEKTVVSPSWDQHKYPIDYECKLDEFRTEHIDKAMSSMRSSKNEEKPGAHNLIFVFMGKIANNVVDVKMYRFCVKRTHSAQLWYYLKEATQFVPENIQQIWIENKTQEEQDTYLTNALNSVVDSGIESDNMLPSQSMLYLDENVWRFSDERDADVYYIYYQIKNLSSLRSLMDGDRQNNIDTNSLKYKRYLYKLAKYIQQLHHNGIVYGYVALRNVVISPEGTDGSSMFLQSESFFYQEKQFTGEYKPEEEFKNEEKTAKARRKCFDPEQRDDPSNFNKSSDVFAFGLCLMELLCKQSSKMQSRLIRSIRSYNIFSHVNPTEFPEFQACWDDFGELLVNILVPRDQRKSIDYVVDYLEKKCQYN